MPRPYTLKPGDDRGKRLQPNTAPDTSGDTVPLPAKVPSELKKWVKGYAEATGKTQSQIVREALQQYRDSVKSE